MTQDTASSATYGRSGFQVDKLTSTNYSSWKTDCKIVLFEKKLWKYVNPTKQEIDVPTETDVENKTHAFNCIWMLMNKSEQQHLRGVMNPWEVWRKLQEYYEAQTPA